MQNLKPYISLDTMYDTIFDAHFERILVIGFTSMLPM